MVIGKLLEAPQKVWKAMKAVKIYWKEILKAGEVRLCCKEALGRTEESVMFNEKKYNA